MILLNRVKHLEPKRSIRSGSCLNRDSVKSKSPINSSQMHQRRVKLIDKTTDSDGKTVTVPLTEAAAVHFADDRHQESTLV